MSIERMKEPWPPEVPLKPGDLVVVTQMDTEEVCEFKPGDVAVLQDRGICGCWSANFAEAVLIDGRPANKGDPYPCDIFVGTGEERRHCPGGRGVKIRKVPWR